jgi:hypothetical protein
MILAVSKQEFSVHVSTTLLCFIKICLQEFLYCIFKISVFSEELKIQRILRKQIEVKEVIKITLGRIICVSKSKVIRLDLKEPVLQQSLLFS